MDISGTVTVGKDQFPPLRSSGPRIVEKRKLALNDANLKHIFRVNYDKESAVDDDTVKQPAEPNENRSKNHNERQMSRALFCQSFSYSHDW